MYDTPIRWKVIYMYISNLHKCVLLLLSIDQEVPTEDIKYSLTKSAQACRWITSVLSIVHTYRRSNRANAEEKMTWSLTLHLTEDKPFTNHTTGNQSLACNLLIHTLDIVLLDFHNLQLDTGLH